MYVFLETYTYTLIGGSLPAFYLLNVNNRNTRTRCEICSKLTIKTPERRHGTPCSCVSIVNFEHVIAGWVESINSKYYGIESICALVVVLHRSQKHEVQTLITLQNIVWLTLISELFQVEGMNNSYGGVEIGTSVLIFSIWRIFVFL